MKYLLKLYLIKIGQPDFYIAVRLIIFMFKNCHSVQDTNADTRRENIVRQRLWIRYRDIGICHITTVHRLCME
jgi:hypothetical protein